MSTATVQLGRAWTDTTLMAAIADDDRQALDELFRRYERTLLAYAQRRLADRMDAEELVQETILRMWRMAERFDPTKGSVDCLVFTLASRVLADLFRRRSRRVVTDELGTPDEHTIGDHADSADMSLQVRGALARLSADHRAVLELAYYRGMSQREVAAHLGIPLGTVKTRTYWALRAMQTALAA
jgi:RNA polymerase sigma-70 factor (ECF subfamily)